MVTQIRPWAVHYKKGLSAVPSTRMGYAIVAVKNELNYNGFNIGLNLVTPKLGKGFDKSARAFQAAKGLKVDGDIGPVTGKELIRQRIEAAQVLYHIPENLLAGQIGWESAYDPAAIFQNDTSIDRGPIQANSVFNANLSDEQAYGYKDSIPYLAAFQASKANHYLSCAYDEHKLAVGSWRSPQGADYLCAHPDTPPVSHQGQCSDAECWGEQVAYYISKVVGVAAQW